MGLSFEYVVKLYAGFRERCASPRFTHSEILRREKEAEAEAVLPTPYAKPLFSVIRFFPKISRRSFKSHSYSSKTQVLPKKRKPSKDRTIR